jgi:hypothetical protein
MKSIYILAIALLTAISASATVRTVSNINGIDADYTTITAAINASMAGDTIYLLPSPTNYGSFSINKQLFILGAGHNPEYTAYNAAVTTMTLSSSSSGTVIKGLQINTIATDNNVINNVVIGNNYINNSGVTLNFNNSGTHNNWIFEGNIMYTQSSSYFNFLGLGANLILRNNYIHIASQGGVISYLPSGSVLDHNIFTAFGTSVMSYPIVNSSNIVIQNNIFYFNVSNSMSPVDYCVGCTWEKNIFYNQGGTIYNLPPGNFPNQEPSMVNFNNVFSYVLDLRLSASSPGLGQATDGTDIGIHGGIYPFSIFGFDAGLPRIAEFELLNTSAPQGGTISIQLRANGSGQ